MPEISTSEPQGWFRTGSERPGKGRGLIVTTENDLYVVEEAAKVLLRVVV